MNNEKSNTLKDLFENQEYNKRFIHLSLLFSYYMITLSKLKQIIFNALDQF